VWRFKYMLYGMAFPALLGVALYFAAPSIVDWVEDEVGRAAANEVEETFAREVPATVEPGQIVITEQQLLNALLRADAEEDSFDASGYAVEIRDGEVRIVNEDRDRTSENFVIASVVPEVVDGRLVLTNRGGFLTIFKTARDAIADEIEEEAAAIFARSNVRPVNVSAENRRLVIVVEAIDGAPETTAEPEEGATEAPEPTAAAPTRTPIRTFLRTPTPTP
jgi:hypothetical protein